MLVKRLELEDFRKTAFSIPLLQRVCNLESVVTCSVGIPTGSPCHHDDGTVHVQRDWGLWKPAISADILAKECAAAKSIQKAWRRRLSPRSRHNVPEYVSFAALPSCMAHTPLVVLPTSSGRDATDDHAARVILRVRRSCRKLCGPEEAARLLCTEEVATISDPVKTWVGDSWAHV